MSCIEALGSRYLLDECLYTHHSTYDSTEDSIPANGNSVAEEAQQAAYELYTPVPPGLSKEQARQYHMATRNFFAFASSKPLVGEKLSISLVELLERIRAWQPQTAALANFMLYCEKQSYLSLTNNVDHALACLVLAEQAHLKVLWIDAFSHTVGMHDQVAASPECASLSSATWGLIIRASLEMDLHIVKGNAGIRFLFGGRVRRGESGAVAACSTPPRSLSELSAHLSC